MFRRLIIACSSLFTLSSTFISADGPIDPKQVTNPYNSKETTARIAALFTKEPLNDPDHGSGSEPGPGPGPAKGPDPLKKLAESVSNTLIILGDTGTSSLEDAIFSDESLPEVNYRSPYKTSHRPE